MSDVFMMDCVGPDVDVLHARFPDRPAAGYVTGGPGIEWTEPQFALFARKIRICQQPMSDPAAAQARVIDVETGAATEADVPGFITIRDADGHDDGTVYCSLYKVPAVLTEVQASGLTVPRWWLAWYWSRPGHPTAAQVLAELHALTGVDLDPAALWACQYAAHGRWDNSVVYGTPDFSRQ